MSRSGCTADSIPAPPVMEPLRLLVDEVVNELGRAHELIRTRAEELVAKLADVACERQRIERERLELARQRQALVEPAAGADSMKGAARPAPASAADIPEVTCQQPIAQPMPARVLPAAARVPEPARPSPSAEQFRKLRRDAKRRIKGLG